MTQSFSFNLVDESWIPCVRADGSTAVLTIRDAFAQAHTLKAIAGESPPVTAALHRFLLAILHRVFGPANYDKWAGLWEAEQWEMDALNAYLDKWRHRLDLFDEKRPFYQSPDDRMKTKSTISLSHDRASGNNSTLFDHHTEANGETLPPAQAARILIAAQAYGLAGLSGVKGLTFTDGTCAGGIIFLVEGDNLKQTFLLNMIQYPPDNDHFSVHTEKDKPAWEMEDPFTPNRANPLGYLDYLTWQNRRILFHPEQHKNETVIRTMTMGPALRYDPFLLDPMKHYRADKKLGHVAVSLNERRTFWRDSASFFTFHDDIKGNARPPAIFKWLRELVYQDSVLDSHYLYRCRAMGMSKKQAKVFFFREERLPLPLSYLVNDQLVAKLETALEKTNTLAFDLVQSARLMGMLQQLSTVEDRGWQKQWQGLNVNAKGSINNWITHTGMERNYWAGLDIPFQAFIITLAQNEEKALADWRDQLQKSAQAAFEQAADYVRNDGRSFKAIVRGQSYLNYRLNELLPNKEKAE
ncbi:MAG: type I-E CRISPR-associated protein Cse1/CasA [Chloroflexi bacterium]|nr:type I-E CRISPR-associated protein Cse1/CasA [Chloroflexota bacterium]